jgi:hypothetical protein
MMRGDRAQIKAEPATSQRAGTRWMKRPHEMFIATPAVRLGRR